MDAFRELFTNPSLTQAATILFKMGLAVVLAGAVGWERELRGHPAGVRTHMLIALGVVLFGEVSKMLDPSSPARVSANIVTGIGFLGAGTILRQGPEVKGLTTAASIWAIAGVALAVSAGGAFYVVAVLGTILTLFTLALVNKLEIRFVPDIHPHEMTIVIDDEGNILTLLKNLEGAEIKVIHVRVVKRNGEVRLNIDMKGPRRVALQTAMSTPGVTSAGWMDETPYHLSQS